MSAGVFIQSRLGSSRLPAKAMLDFYGHSILERVIQRCRLSGLPVFVLTSKSYLDDYLVKVAVRARVDGIYRGSLEDVRSRFYEASKRFQITKIVRVTADNPFTETTFISECIKGLDMRQYCRVSPNDCPYGTNVEAFNYEILARSIQQSSQLIDIEHVTPWMIDCQKLLAPGESIQSSRFSFVPNVSGVHLSIDTIEDYTRILNLTKNISEAEFESPDLVKNLLKKIF